MMLTSSGMGLAIGVTWCIFGVIALVITVRQFMQKGCLFSAVYLSVPKEDQQRLQQKKLYHAIGYVFLYVTIVSLSLGLFFLFDHTVFAYCAVLIALSGLLNALIRIAIRDK